MPVADASHADPQRLAQILRDKTANHEHRAGRMSKFRQSLSLALALLCLGAAFYAPMRASPSGEPAWEPPSNWSARVLDWRRQSARIELSERFSSMEKHAAQQTLFESRFNARERRALLQAENDFQRRALSASPPSSR